MPFLSTFITSAILAIVAAFALLNVMIPPGGGSFGAAKMAPLILVVFVVICFCLIWLPVNLITWLTYTPEQRGKTSDAKPDFAFSGMLFLMALATSGYCLAPQWLHKVHFYYKLVDQFEQPVSGVIVHRHNNFTTSADDAESESDAQGLFQETCKPGESFTLNLHKEGYTIASFGLTGAYSEELRNKQKAAQGSHNLIVVKMWKLQGAGPLVGINRRYKVHYVSTPMNFDLLTGDIVPVGGDVRLTVSRLPGVISVRNRLDWSVQIEAVDGGVMDSGGQEQVTYEAPESGYLQSLTFNFSTNEPHGWSGGFNQGFYITSRNGQVYSKLGLSFVINEKPDDFMSVAFGGVASTNGSRNWEGDPSTWNNIVK